MRSNVLMVLAAVLLAGCVEGRSAFGPNQDYQLRKSVKAFAADAQTRHYPTTAPSAGRAPMRAEVDYQLKLINLVNLSDEQWNDAELWVNGQYVCFLPRIQPKIQKTINFQILFDDHHKSFPTSLATESVKKLQVFANGSLYDVQLHLAD